MATGIISKPAGRRRQRCWRRMLVRVHLFAAILWLDAILTCSGQKPINLGGVKKRDVYIAGFFPYGSHVPECHVGRGVMPSVKLAVDHINEDPTVLRNYRLHMCPPKDTQYPDTGWCFILTNNYICHLVGAVPC
ncbi:gamma-aminobutyric acid type B receptor subunit 2 isoform X1 [Vespula maculifrons]|uniref:Gamma-aminobutyric acid type B receptor subunit 2 isoform X1 n=1 Tax=Vespula maculifrons TaxID=7453 RepID=A0ABD2BC71_VESMC